MQKQGNEDERRHFSHVAFDESHTHQHSEESYLEAAGKDNEVVLESAKHRKNPRKRRKPGRLRRAPRSKEDLMHVMEAQKHKTERLRAKRLATQLARQRERQASAAAMASRRREKMRQAAKNGKQQQKQQRPTKTVNRLRGPASSFGGLGITGSGGSANMLRTLPPQAARTQLQGAQKLTKHSAGPSSKQHSKDPQGGVSRPVPAQGPTAARGGGALSQRAGESSGVQPSRPNPEPGEAHFKESRSSKQETLHPLITDAIVAFAAVDVDGDGAVTEQQYYAATSELAVDLGREQARCVEAFPCVAPPPPSHASGDGYCWCACGAQDVSL